MEVLTFALAKSSDFRKRRIQTAHFSVDKYYTVRIFLTMNHWLFWFWLGTGSWMGLDQQEMVKKWQSSRLTGRLGGGTNFPSLFRFHQFIFGFFSKAIFFKYNIQLPNGCWWANSGKPVFYLHIYIARFFTYRDHIPSSFEDIRFAFARAAGLFVPRSFYYVCLRRCHKKAKRPTIFSIERGSYRGTLKGPGWYRMKQD